VSSPEGSGRRIAMVEDLMHSWAKKGVATRESQLIYEGGKKCPVTKECEVTQTVPRRPVAAVED